MRTAHLSNPAAKSASRLLRLLEHHGPFNKTEVFGLLCGSLESPAMSRCMSQTILESVFKCWARVSGHELWPDYWECLRDHFDQMLATAWQRSQSSGLSRAQFLRAWREPLSLFMSMTLATAIEKQVEDREEVDARSIEEMTKGPLIAAELYAEESMACELTSYMTSIDARLLELELQHFDPEECVAFRQICMAEAESLHDNLWEAAHGRELYCNLISGACASLTLNPNDEWSYRYDARIKTLCISSYLVPRFPWEIHLYGKSGPIPGVAETVKVPPSLVFDIGSCREFVLKLLGQGLQSVESCRKIIRANLKYIQKLDKTFWLDDVFLTSCFDALIESHLKSCLLECLPQPDQRRSLPKAVLAARTLCTGPTVSAQAKVLERELLSATNLLQDMSECRGPSAQE